jgi:hypothetical protein
VLNHFFAEYASLEQQIVGPIVDWQSHTAKGTAVIDVGAEPNLVFYNAKKDSDILHANSAQLNEFISRITEIHYLDGHRYPSHPIVCKSVAELSKGVPIVIHLTPRQRNSTEKFIGLELAAFHNTVDQCGGFIREKDYLRGAPADLDTHFKILREFKP